jgi:hypothetical protein
MSSIGLRLPSFPTSRQRVEVTWADKFAFYAAIGWAGLLLVGWSMAWLACGYAGACLLAKDTGVLALESGLALVVPIWFVMTGLDVLFKGPKRRKAKAE